MADRINELIKIIGEKVSSLKNQLSVEKSNSESLQRELSKLKEDLISKDKEIQDQKSEIIRLEKQIEIETKQDVSEASGSNVSDVEIDELVKEIEYCIGQLKK